MTNKYYEILKSACNKQDGRLYLKRSKKQSDKIEIDDELITYRQLAYLAKTGELVEDDTLASISNAPALIDSAFIVEKGKAYKRDIYNEDGELI